MKLSVISACLLLAAGWTPASAESVTLTTYYPAPYGGYAKILTTGETTLARDGDFVTVGKAGDAADKLLVYGNGKVKDLYIANTGDVFVKVPRPPAGKTLAWEPVWTGSEVDQYQPAGDYAGAPHSDTCDGNTSAAYACPDGVKKVCLDVQKTQDKNCDYSGWNNKAGGMEDTCNSRNQPYGACDKTCTDLDCTDWVGGGCINRSWRSITYTPARHRDVNVTCTSMETVMVLVAK